MSDATMFLGKGFQFPPRVDATTGRFVMSEGEEDIQEAIFLILKTRLEVIMQRRPSPHERENSD